MGYFGPATSNINWCEEDYAVSFYIAEFYNTVSNIPSLLLSLFGLVLAIRHRHDLAIQLAYLLLASVFVGSTLFHGTLLYHYQLADELPMIYGTCTLLYLVCSDFDKKSEWKKPLLIAVLVMLAVGITVIMLVMRDSPYPLQVSYGFLVAVLTIRCVYIAFTVEFHHSYYSRFMLVSVSLYLFAFACWLVDRHLCHHVQSLPVQLHAWWHILTGYSTYIWVQAATLFRLHIAQRKHEFLPFHLKDLLPFVVSKDNK